ncbi:MAG: MoaD/ThiS family protein [Acidobacteriota bacterium]
MPRVVFTPNLTRHISSPPTPVSGRTVQAALRAVFEDNPRLRSYILDDQDRLREHVVVFIDGQMVQDRATLSDPVENDSEIFVMQALSGG